MIDRELYEAEELDSYVEMYQASQTAVLPTDLPQLEWRLTDILLEISTITLPDPQFLVDLENQIYEIDRKPLETTARYKNVHSNEQPEGSTGRETLLPLGKIWHLLWPPLVASIAVALLLMFFTASLLL